LRTKKRKFLGIENSTRRFGFERNFSYMLKGSELNYGTIEKELYSIVKNLIYFKHIIGSSPHELMILTEQKTLKVYEKFKIVRSRLIKRYKEISCTILNFYILKGYAIVRRTYCLACTTEQRTL
jgi:RNase H-like domain found in reverse transcriptase